MDLRLRLYNSLVACPSMRENCCTIKPGSYNDAVEASRRVAPSCVTGRSVGTRLSGSYLYARRNTPYTFDLHAISLQIACNSDWESEYDNNSESHDDLEELILVYLPNKKQKRKRRSWCVRPIFSRRKQQGEYHNLLQEMRLSDPHSHFHYLRMSRERFDSLLSLVCSVVPILHNSTTKIYCTIIYTRLVHYCIIEDSGVFLENLFLQQKG